MSYFEFRLTGLPVTVPDVDVDAVAWHKIHSACRITRKLVAENPVQPDYSNDYMAVQAWPFVTALYNGIEQALKMLLLAPFDSILTLDDLRKRPYGHDLERLYAELASDDREHIERHFREHWSLYEYGQLGLKFNTAEKFVAHINRGGAQGGLVSWRYTLLDPSVRIPQTNPWTMCELWDSVCCRIKTKALNQQDHCSRLSRRLFFPLRRIANSTPAPYDDFIDDLGIWMAHRGGDYLAAWVDLLVKASRRHIEQVQAPERLLPELAQMADRAIKAMSREPADPDEKQILSRVEQTDRDLVWNPFEAQFGWASDAEN